MRAYKHPHLSEQHPDQNRIEFKACFPEGTWFGIGLGGFLMTNTELVFFMAPTLKEEQRVISLRMRPGKKSGRPDNMPVDSPVY